jgi:hypothetical protein
LLTTVVGVIAGLLLLLMRHLAPRPTAVELPPGQSAGTSAAGTTRETPTGTVHARLIDPTPEPLSSDQNDPRYNAARP